MNYVFEDNRHLRKFFHQHPDYQAIIYQDVAHRLTRLIEESSPKIKMVRQFKHHGLKIYEYKIICDKSLTCRVAYTLDKETITVFFISETIIKNQFCQLLGKTELV
ncbi:hypothetical protein [Photobacterium damselae]|uniref:hypothetical protein n=1 Tax=Photobacterium damselae TaxID=38293 RepID=UPI001F352161|nr:hypothetical protein [Photobacterium damselae]UKA12293.1 hypothetical protein IHC91_15365 [Photobacterium damselae subsp. damselae]